MFFQFHECLKLDSLLSRKINLLAQLKILINISIFQTFSTFRSFKCDRQWGFDCFRFNYSNLKKKKTTTCFINKSIDFWNIKIQWFSIELTRNEYSFVKLNKRTKTQTKRIFMIFSSFDYSFPRSFFSCHFFSVKWPYV